MKKIFYTLLILIPLGFTACTLRPHADFYVDDTVVYIGEEVWFTNESYNAVDYDWDFGDGTWTDDLDVVHTYNASGIYEVVLTAYSRSGVSSEASVTITVLTPTILEIEVVDWDFEDISVAGANVRLYPTLRDWDDQTNMVIEGNTNANGKVVFFDLEQTYYYVDVWAPDYNNFAIREEATEYIITQDLVPNEINYFIAYADFVTTKKGTRNERDRSVVILKPNRVPKKK